MTYSIDGSSCRGDSMTAAGTAFIFFLAVRCDDTPAGDKPAARIPAEEADARGSEPHVHWAVYSC